MTRIYVRYVHITNSILYLGLPEIGGYHRKRLEITLHKCIFNLRGNIVIKHQISSNCWAPDFQTKPCELF